MLGIFDPTDPTADVQAYLVGGDLGEEFNALMIGFVEQRVMPLANEMAAMGQDPRILLRAFAQMVHAGAKSIEDQAGPED